MKNSIAVITILAGLIFNVWAQNIKRSEFKVLGNCGLCEERIEKAALSVKGVDSAQWDVDNQMLQVRYDAEITSLEKIQVKIAEVGHDTEKVKTSNKTYRNLHSCCKYDRVEENTSGMQTLKVKITGM